IKAQVLITSTSASSALEVISIPRSNTLPSMISASTRFLAQPRLIIPTFAGCSGGRACPELVEWVVRLDFEFAAETAASTERLFGDFCGGRRVACSFAAAATAVTKKSLGFTIRLFANRNRRWRQS